MLPVPEYESLVDGFKVNVVPNPTNIASGIGGKGSHLIEDGFLKIDVENTGQNPFWPNSFKTAALVVRLLDADKDPEVVSDYSTCVLGPDDSPVFAMLSEKDENGLYGVWLEVLCESPDYPEEDAYLSFGFRIDKPEGYGNA